MNNNNIPPSSELPSGAKLVKSTLVAIAAAAVILITGVLPAEYGIDPTGIGKVLGLSKMGEIKVSLAQEALAQQNATVLADATQQPVTEPTEETVASTSEVSLRTDEMTLSLGPNESTEIKLKMNKGEQVTYIWWVDNGQAFFDTHADSKKLRINYQSYEKGTKDRAEGVLEAQFDGKHGWYWKNRSSKTMTITLQVKGEYSDITKDA